MPSSRSISPSGGVSSWGGRKVSHKRRKLGAGDMRASASTPASGHTNSTTASASPRCGSCYRVVRGPFAHMIVCTRCKQEVCSICSRTCVGWPSSIPLPSATSACHTRQQSNKRSPLNATRLNGAADTSVVGKRRKPSVLDEEIEEDEKTDRSKSDFTMGCSQPICRCCCYESPHNQGLLCYGCCERLQPRSPEDVDDTVQMLDV